MPNICEQGWQAKAGATTDHFLFAVEEKANTKGTTK